jgi:hypothetical protein
MGGGVGPEPGGERHLHTVRSRGAQLVQRHVDACGVDLRAARTLEPRCTGELADHRDDVARRRPERQRSVLVLQQHHAVGRHLPGQFVVCVDVDHGRGPRLHRGAVDQLEYPVHREIQDGLLELAGPHGGYDGSIADAEVGRHLQVQPRGERGHPVVHRAPVRDHQPVEAPFVAQYRAEQPPALCGIGTVDLVVSAHHRPRVRPGDHALEAGQIDLPERALVHLRTHRQPVRLLVVHREMLDRSAYALALDPLDQRGAEGPGQQRVLREVLEVATAQRRALDVDARAQHDGHALRPGLPA